MAFSLSRPVERRTRLVLGAGKALWALAGLLAVGGVVGAAVRLSSEDLTRSATGDSVVAIFLGALCAAVSVCLLGLYGVWAGLFVKLLARLSASESDTTRPGTPDRIH
ncbi:hypothetical protein [Mycobacterium xenopi]|uniref:hypothetical protein n=1 Tax=Mycobacterium xenopi TaxID=1789 RepID=UPI00111C36C0|nr:hypothetical protein [Mycobacterium xenopi]